MTTADAASLLKANDRFLILTHRRPDGDTVGSAALLCRALRSLGKTAFVFDNPELTRRFCGLLEGLLPPDGFTPGYIVAVDTADTVMFPEAGLKYAYSVDLVIDHHGSNTRYAANNLIEASAAAAGEIIMDILDLLHVPLDCRMAEALYISVSTDTGCFKYANTTAKSLRTAARCYDAGINAAPINRECFETKSRARFSLERYIFENMEFFEDGRIAFVFIPRSIVVGTGALPDDFDTVSALPRQIEGVCIGVVMIETRTGGSRISVRTVETYDSARVCAELGGGGHQGAAGSTVSEPPDVMRPRIIEAALRELRRV